MLNNNQPIRFYINYQTLSDTW